MASAKKYKISSLPITPSSHLLTHNLTGDPVTGGASVSTFLDKVLAKTPSVQRRARLTSPETHFSYVTPLPVSFPYNIEPPSADESEQTPNEDQGAYIEKWLSEKEPRIPKAGSNSSSGHLKLHYSETAAEDQPRILIGLSETGLRDCVPHLDVGDAFATLGEPSFSTTDSEGNPSVHASTVEEVVSARQELIDVLGGRAVLMSEDYPKSESGSDRAGFAPWSLRYSGHQFGTWAGQLGDGRAVSILATPHPSNPSESYELQLKGAGRTPYSRSADGLAVLRSSIREYLCSEAMSALSIPTTRSLSLVSLPTTEVRRERMETACLLTRMAPSFIRIGSFEALSPPDGLSTVFFGGGQQKPDWEGLRVLGEWVSKRVLQLDLPEGAPWGKELVLEVARRNAKMVAGWQAYGFMHGVINTDNVSILGLTIDYGPYAFMSARVLLLWRVSSGLNDRLGTSLTPNISVIIPTMAEDTHTGIFALRALLNSLSPLIGAETETKKAISTEWAVSVSEDKIKEWRQKGSEEVKDEMERILQEETSIAYGSFLRKRLGLRRPLQNDETQIFRPLLEMMENHRLDFHRTFRLLSFFRPSSTEADTTETDAFIEKVLKNISPSERLMVDNVSAKKAWGAWLEKFKGRIEEDRECWKSEQGDVVSLEQLYELRSDEAKRANPRFVLRQWVLEEVIKRVENDQEKGKRLLAKVMHMASNPFEQWGAEGMEMTSAEQIGTELDSEEQEERRFCSIGEESYLGFQCSCSS